MKEIKKWIAILAMLALVLTTLFTGIVAASPEGEQPAAEEQSVEEPADTEAETPESEEPAGDESAEEEPASEEEPATDEEPSDEAEDPVDVDEPDIIEGETEEEDDSELPDDETEETEEIETVVEVPEEEESDEADEPVAELEPQLPQDAEALCHPKGKICVIKFKDKNCNGRKDGNEPGLGGVEITLRKGDKTWKKTTPHHGPNRGKVCFDNLQLGTYTVSEGGKDGYYATTPTSKQVTLTRCNKNQTVYFGNAPYLSICGRKFMDENRNGRWDFGEPPMKDVTICLSMGDNPNHADGQNGANNSRCVKTDWKGRYCFDGLMPGTYTVGEIVPEGYRQTYPEGGVHVVTLRCGQDATGINFGNAPTTGSICGTKFKDKNCDGDWDCGEWGLKGVTILLEGEGIELSTKTNWKGNYCFEGLRPGTYTLSEQVPNGYFQTYPAGGTHEVILECGEEIKNINFGNAPCGKIWGFKWEDKDCSGGLSCGDRPMAGVEIQLWQDGQLVETDTTCFLGIYKFDTCLEPGIYTIREVVPEGFHPSYPYGGEYTVELGCGQCKILCFFNAPNGSICGYKFWDKNCNGEWDDGEPPIEGVTICLYPGENGNGTAALNGNNNGMCTTTDETGNYCFDNLPPGCYLVYETPPEGFYATTPNPVPVELGCGENREGVNFGNASYGSICGTKYLDENCNGEWDEGEPGIPDVRICLTMEDNDEEVVTAIENEVNGNGYCTLTDENGDFCFDGLYPGDYIVTVDESTAPENTYPSTDTSVEVTLGCGEKVEGILFGNAPYGEITGLKLVDTDGDGEGDEPLAGVTIELWKDGALIDSAVTDENGEVQFDKLEAGTYLVKEIVPEGYHNIGATEEEVEICGDEKEVTFVNARFGMINGTKYLDADGDGIIDPGEEVMGGVTITLTEKGKVGALASTQSKDNGTFSFEGLKSSTYIVTEVVPEGTYQTGHAEWEVFVGPDDNIPVAFLNAPYGSISGTKWNDVNRNGVADEGETGMGGVTITLNGTTLGGTPVTIVTTTYTDGTYYFSNLEAGTYTVTETIPGGMEATSEAGKTVTLIPGEDLTVDFHNAAIVLGVIIGPQIEAQLPYTGMNQLSLILAGAALLLLGLMALALGILRFRGSIV